MARNAQSIISSYHGYEGFTNPFTQVNLSPNKTEGVTSYDNAEQSRVMRGVYHFAQQKVSRLMPLINPITIDQMFIYKDRVNKSPWEKKTEEAPFTPLFVPSGSTRGFAPVQYHRGIQVSRLAQKYRRYAVMPEDQLEASYSLARAFDNNIIEALTSPVQSRVATASATFRGQPSINISNLPDSSIYAHLSGNVWQDPSTDLFDDLCEILENQDLDVNNLWIIGSPKLRRKLKKISDFRDMEKTIHFRGGSENVPYIRWEDFNFVFMGPETKPNSSYGISGTTKFGPKGGSPVASGGTALGASNVAAGKVDSFIITDFSTLTWGTAPFLTESFSSLRDDLSYTPQMYATTAFGGMRVDDNKVKIVHYKAD